MKNQTFLAFTLRKVFLSCPEMLFSKKHLVFLAKACYNDPASISMRVRLPDDTYNIIPIMWFRVDGPLHPLRWVSIAGG